MIDKAAIYIAIGAMLALGGCRAVIAVYRDEGTSRESAAAGSSMFRRMGYKARILNASEIRSGKLAGCDVLYIPDGDPYAYARKLRLKGYGNIWSFVGSGGGFIAVGRGAAFASKLVYCDGETLPTMPLRLFPDDEADVTVIGAYENTRSAGMVTFEFGDGRAFLTGLNFSALDESGAGRNLMQRATTWVAPVNEPSPHHARRTLCLACLLVYLAGLAAFLMIKAKLKDRGTQRSAISFFQKSTW